MIGTVICQDCEYSFYVYSYDTAYCPLCGGFMDFYEDEDADLSDLDDN